MNGHLCDKHLGRLATELKKHWCLHGVVIVTSLAWLGCSFLADLLMWPLCHHAMQRPVGIKPGGTDLR
jgi:hypothetical protein